MTPAWECTIDGLVTTPESNSREHWHVKALRHSRQREAVRSAWRQNPRTIANLENTPIIIYICRVAPRKLDNHDNLPTSLKSILDEICNCILPGYADGRADGKLKLKVAYAQEKGKVRQYAVKIKLFILEHCAADLTDCEILPDTSHCICRVCQSVVPLS